MEVAFVSAGGGVVVKLNKMIVVVIVMVTWIIGTTEIKAASVEVQAGTPMGGEQNQQQTGTLGNVGGVKRETVEAKVLRIVSMTEESYGDGQTSLQEQVEVEVTSGSLVGQKLVIDYNRLLAMGEKPIKVGDRVMVDRSVDSEGQNESYYIVDFVRTPSLEFLFLVFVVMVAWVGGRQGLQSLVGLGMSLVILAVMVMPGIKAGYDPVLVTVVASALIIGLTFYMSHGLNQKTNWAAAGTILALVLTGILARIFVEGARLTGFASDEAVFLQFMHQGGLNMQGVLLSGMIIGALGVLDDITVSQASIVYELKMANSKLSTAELFKRAMRVGRDHISSMANTLVLVYAGSALPLLLLFSVDKSRSFSHILSYEVVAEEVVRTLVGSIGLVAAVPITTYIAAKYGFKKKHK